MKQDLINAWPLVLLYPEHEAEQVPQLATVMGEVTVLFDLAHFDFLLHYALRSAGEWQFESHKLQ